MNSREKSNIIIGLRKKGWDDTEITNFILYIETHVPTSEEVNEEKIVQK